MAIPISVVLCTYNRIERLQRCVAALRAVRSEQDWELVIVDNGSDDGTGAFLAALPPDTFRPRIVKVVESKRGLATARNTGVRLARGNIIAFTDDDCYVSPDYIDALILAFASEPLVGFLGGRILLHDQSDLRITIQESEEYRTLAPRTFIDAGTVQGANMAFRKTCLDRIGGFDENFGVGSGFACEDIDAAAASLWAGIAGAYDPRPKVFHHHGRKTKSEEDALWCFYDKGRGAYYVKYILRRDSRSEYFRNWMRSIRSDLLAAVNAARKGRYSSVRRSRNEILGGLEYFIVWLWNERRR
jgi:hypothetical protein